MKKKVIFFFTYFIRIIIYEYIISMLFSWLLLIYTYDFGKILK